VDHDNGYGAVLSAALTGGHGERLALLQAHQDMAREIRSLNLKTFHIDDLFMEHSIQMTSPVLTRSPPQPQSTSWANAAALSSNGTGAQPPATPKIIATPAAPSKPYAPPTPRVGEKKPISARSGIVQNLPKLEFLD
jgi:hypothetical protein